MTLPGNVQLDATDAEHSLLHSAVFGPPVFDEDAAHVFSGLGLPPEAMHELAAVLKGASAVEEARAPAHIRAVTAEALQGIGQSSTARSRSSDLGLGRGRGAR